MPELTPNFYTEQQWLIAKRSLENEFDIQFEKIQVKDQVKKLFFNYVELHHFSCEACIALYYRLFFFSTLILVQILDNEGVEMGEFNLRDLLPVWEASKERSTHALDTKKLESNLENINQSIELLIFDLIKKQ
jgi:glucose-6-phosphate isomerase